MKMARLLALCLILCLLPATVLAAAPCSAAREVGEGFVVQPAYATPAGDEVFANALLIGDSIAGSIADYNAFPALEVEAYIGLSPILAHKSPVMRMGDNYITMYRLAVEAKPDKLFIMLGSNGLDYKTAEVVLPDYHALLDDLITHLPETEIYILSVTPVSPKARTRTPRLTTENVNDFNAGLLRLAQTHGVHYIDLSDGLMNADNTAINERYIAGDGVHLTPPGIAMVVENIRLHTNR